MIKHHKILEKSQKAYEAAYLISKEKPHSIR